MSEKLYRRGNWPPMDAESLARGSGHACGQLLRELPAMERGQSRIFQGPVHGFGSNAGLRAWDFMVTCE